MPKDVAAQLNLASMLCVRYAGALRRDYQRHKWRSNRGG